MEHLSVERNPKGFKVRIEGAPHQVYLVLGVLSADICETYKIRPDELAGQLPNLIWMATAHLTGGNHHDFMEAERDIYRRFYEELVSRLIPAVK